ncbi:TM1812 family CRISPR-associated protein [uncultured Selenomonas sp.]|uniref:TM1812 family CRISPR-associated protein n=1 Tax=uncultured Selenomonas sp. TaxID=159275 RepID=UPI0028E279A8|nr:TM1812 family CRISPR-associated protein [uncultured Selenomonas sp.]
MNQNIAINFFSPVRCEKDPDAETGLRISIVREGNFILEAGSEPFPGFQTNEAPLANVVDLLAQKGERLHRVYCLVTPQCLSAEMGGEDRGLVVEEHGERSKYPSQFEFWCSRMKRLRPALAETDFIPILLHYHEDTLIEDIESQVASLTERIKADAGGFAEWHACHIYADITGGARYVTMMMTSVMQFLQYDGMRVEKMIYADFKTLSLENRIFDVHGTLDVYKLVAGADAFVSYGISRTIEKYFDYDAESGTSGKPISDALKGVLRAMHTFSDAIQICQTGNIPPALSALSTAITVFLDVPEEDRTVDDRMFMQLIDTITEGYGELLGETEDEAERYVPIIRWCIDKGLLQQAMTLATEWLPVCFVRQGIVRPVPAYISCAERAVDRMHPGWMQNFIISPAFYWNTIQEMCVDTYRPILTDALESGIVPEGAPSLVSAVRGVRQTFSQLRSNMEGLRTLPADVQEIYELVCISLEKGNRGQSWTVRGLLQDNNAWHLIKSQILKKKNNLLVYRLLGIKQCAFRQGNPNDIEERWAAWEDTWIKMLDTMGIVQTDCGRKHMMSCLRAYFYLREQRNQVNHATAENTLGRREIEGLLDNVLEELSAAASNSQEER